jgi:predicted protein tyrosine phosphatase
MNDDTIIKQNLPFVITICGIEELPGHAERQVSHVLSILDPDRVEPEAFGAYGEHARLELRFDDIIEERTGQEAPQSHHVEQILTFGQDILADPKSLRHLLVHCHMGVSRSTAAMTLLLARAQPDMAAPDVLRQILAVRDKAWPNLRMLTLGEELLGRPGEFSEAVAELYAYQLNRRPQLEDFFLEVGREREVALAKRFRKA